MLNRRVLVRFIAGQATPTERDAIEDRLVRDSTFLEKLERVEFDLLLAFARREIQGAQATALDQVLRQPGPRRDAFTHARLLVEEGRGELRLDQPRARSGRNAAPRRPTPQRGPARVGRGTLRNRTRPKVVRVLLLPGNSRKGTRSRKNAFPAAKQTTSVALRVVVAPGQAACALARIDRVGGGTVATVRPTTRRVGGGTGVTAVVPARALKPGDYVLTLQTAAGEHEPRTLATRFFSVLG